MSNVNAPIATRSGGNHSLTNAVRALFPAIEPARIVGHADIAPGRKTDPGPRFDWVRYRRLINPRGDVGQSISEN